MSWPVTPAVVGRAWYSLDMSRTIAEQEKSAREVTLRVRISRGADNRLAELAQREARTKADTVRLMLTYASAHMPEGYTGR